MNINVNTEHVNISYSISFLKKEEKKVEYVNENPPVLQQCHFCVNVKYIGKMKKRGR